MSETPLPPFVEWSSFPFEGDLRVKTPDEPVAVEPARVGEDASECPKCHAPDDAYIWVNENWRVRSMDRPSGLPMVLILECRSHLDLGDLPNMLAAELGVMTVRLERAIRSIDGVARVHVNRWGDGTAHLHLWFLARPYGRLQLRGTFLTLWDEILPPIPEHQWQENLALIAAWLAEFGGEPLAKPPRIDWKAPSSFEQMLSVADGAELALDGAELALDEPEPMAGDSVATASGAESAASQPEPARAGAEPMAGEPVAAANGAEPAPGEAGQAPAGSGGVSDRAGAAGSAAPAKPDASDGAGKATGRASVGATVDSERETVDQG